MALLAATAYDPTTAASAATSSPNKAMTALDTTNLRLTFTAPANGIVLVRLRTAHAGATTSAMFHLGVMEGATIKGRMAPCTVQVGGAAGPFQQAESQFVVTGLTPGNSYTWDAAYGTEDVVASSALKWGGPNDTTTNNAWGAFIYEIWETSNLLGGILYDPASVATKSLGTLTAMAAFDTTNLRITFTAPASGNVLVKVTCPGGGATGTRPNVFLGALDGATVKGRVAASPAYSQRGTAAATDFALFDVSFPVTGLTPGNSYTWDAAWACETVLASYTLRYGGPDNTTADDAYGGIAYEIWAA